MKNSPSKNAESGQVELLAPAGSLDAGYAALHYGADAVYLGLENFSARASAANFSIDELADITGYAHSRPRPRKIYAALNTLVLQKELGALVDLLAAIADIGVDAVIVQDFGVLNILRQYFPRIKIHASTQMAIHNRHGVEAARELGLARVTLARELTMGEIAGIAAKPGIETEVFVHGALCYSYSGLCLFSSHLYGRSGNRGKCAYPCREWFKPLLAEDVRRNAGQNGGFIFSMKDLALPDYVADLRQAGVTALKIEGRMKNPLYVAAAVNYYRHLIDARASPDKAREMASDLQTIFSRPWTDLYLKTRAPRDVIDAETQGHRGAPAGKVEEIAKNPGGHSLRFKTTLPVELHDGLQIDIAGLPRPFGFAVKGISMITGGRAAEKKRVFEAPAGARIEIQLPRGHPVIPLGAVIYSSSSQKVKQQYGFSRPKPGLFRFRQTADFEVRLEPNGIDVTASANLGGEIKPGKMEVTRHFDGLFQPAQNAGQVDSAIKTAFAKLGDTHLQPGALVINNPAHLFVPISMLNSIRRDVSAALERKIAEQPLKYAAEIKAEMISTLKARQATFPKAPEFHAVIPDPPQAESGIHPSMADHFPCPAAGRHGNDTGKRTNDQFIHDNFNWSLKTDQPHLLSAFGPDDWSGIDELIIECVPELLPEFADQLDRLAGMCSRENLRLALPVIMRRWETAPFTKTVSDLVAKGWRKWQVSNPGAWSLLNNITGNEAARDVSSDWPLYAMNRASVLQFKAMGIGRFTLSPEDSFENIGKLLAEFSSDAVVIAYQDTPLMITETCVFRSENCTFTNACGERRSQDGKPGHRTGKSREMMFSSSHGDTIRVISRNCRCVVLNSRPFCLAAHLKELARAGAINLRADFMHRGYSKEEMLDVWRKLRSGAPIPSGHDANFIRGID